MQWNPPFGRVLRNYEDFVVELRALAIVYVTLSLSALAFAYTRLPITHAHSNSLHKSTRHRSTRSHSNNSLHKSASQANEGYAMGVTNEKWVWFTAPRGHWNPPF